MALCLLLFVTVAAKSFVISTLPTQSQLPVGNIHCIFQDSEGYMWYGTRGGGICRDNGYQIDKLGGKNIYCITEDRKGRIWFGTNDGLYVIDKTNYHPKATPYKGETSAIMCDSQGRLWSCTAGSIFCINTDTSRKILKEQHSQDNAASFYEDSQKNIWILFWGNQIWKYTGGKRPKTVMQQMAIKPTRMIEDKKQNGYWIATWGDGIQFLDKKSLALTPQTSTKLSLEQGQILDMKVDQKRNLIYTSTTDNLYIYQICGRTLIPINTSSFMSVEKKILDGMWLDQEDNLWVGGFIPTTFILSPSATRIQRYPLPIITRQTGYPFIADRCVEDGNLLWISQGRIGLMLYNRTTDKLLDTKGIDANSRLMAKKQQQRGIWCANGNMLLSLEYNSLQQVTVKQICSFDSDIKTIREQNNCLLVGTNSSLYRLPLSKIQTGISKPHPIFSADKPVTQAVADVDGLIYFLVKGKGLYRYTPTRKVSIICNNDYKINTIDISPDGTLWLGAEDGKAYKLPSGKQQLVLQKNLCNANKNAIIDIQVDYLRHIWTLTDQTVKEVNPENGKMRVFHSQDEDIFVSNFYQLEYAGEKRVGIGAAGAYLEISPSLELNGNGTVEYSIIPTSYRTTDTLSIIPQDSKRIIIPANSSNLTLYMSTNHPLDAGKTSFAYKLEEEGNWVYLSQGVNSVYLNNIPAGNSTLLLKSTDEYGRWSEHITKIHLYHIPHWWQTILAKLLFMLAGGGILFSLWLLNKRIHLLSNLQNMRNRLSLSEIDIKTGHEEKALKAENTLKEIIAHIEANITDANYNVQRLSEDMCMSRTNLYRRVHAVSGLSVIEFIRDIRLKQAALILKNHPDTPITTIQKAVGFTSSSYFTKCFKKKFGITPSEYAKQNSSL